MIHNYVYGSFLPSRPGCDLRYFFAVCEPRCPRGSREATRCGSSAQLSRLRMDRGGGARALSKGGGLKIWKLEVLQGDFFTKTFPTRTY